MSREEKQSNTDNPSRKRTIVYFIDGLGMGGAERLLVPILRNLSRDHFSPRVCAFQVRNGNPIAEEIRKLGIPADLIEIPHLRDLTALPRLVKFLKEVKADLVHTQLEFADSLGNTAAKLCGLPSVSTLHTMPDQNDMNWKDKLHQGVEFFILRNFCNLIIAVSEEARQFHLKLIGTPDNHIRTVYNGIDLRHFDEMDIPCERHETREELGIPMDATVLTTLAVLRELKGIQFMIRALPAILEKHPGVYYLIAGDGEYREQLVAEAQKAGMEKRVIFAGMRKDVACILAASDVFVLPTLTEALPTVLAEAMAMRLPILASAVGGVPEMVKDGENGCLVSPGDVGQLVATTNSMLDDPQGLSAMGERGRKITEEKFNVSRQVDQLKDIYLGLIGQYEK